MKKITIVIISVALLAGFAVADPGINQTPETQGINTDTTIDVVGNFASTTDVAWRITNDAGGLNENNGVPDLDYPWNGRGTAYYTSVYTEDTQSNGEGIINYDKSMNVETSERLSGQSNIEATKQINYIGLDGANRVTSTEYIMVDGVGNFSWAGDQMLCVFAGGLVTIAADADNWITLPSIFPASCNFLEAGSTIDMTTANVRTTSSDRFITPSADTSIMLEHDILVSELGSGIPSVGIASTHMQAVIMEARGIHIEETFIPEEEAWRDEISSPLMEQIRFSETTSITGEISTFAKEMGYNSQYTGGGEMSSFEVNQPQGQ